MLCAVSYKIHRNACDDSHERVWRLGYRFETYPYNIAVSLGALTSTTTMFTKPADVGSNGHAYKLVQCLLQICSQNIVVKVLLIYGILTGTRGLNQI
jgi:hypothetical protein